MGAVHITVASLQRSLEYYRALGLREHAPGRLGTGEEDLLVLTEQPGASPADGYAGLFHFALLLPDRAALGRWLAHAARERIALTGLSDHAVSEAVYLRDPDGHGIEIYADRPRAQWEGRVAELMTTAPLDTDDLLAAADGPFEGLPEGTTMGHVHLRVTDVGDAVSFYTGELGMELMARFADQAAFLGWDGYHHHIGVNTWESRGRPTAPDDRARLLSYEVIAGREAELRDSSGITLTLR